MASHTFFLICYRELIKLGTFADGKCRYKEDKNKMTHWITNCHLRVICVVTRGRYLEHMPVSPVWSGRLAIINWKGDAQGYNLSHDFLIEKNFSSVLNSEVFKSSISEHH